MKAIRARPSVRPVTLCFSARKAESRGRDKAARYDERRYKRRHRIEIGFACLTDRRPRPATTLPTKGHGLVLAPQWRLAGSIPIVVTSEKYALSLRDDFIEYQTGKLCVGRRQPMELPRPIAAEPIALYPGISLRVRELSSYRVRIPAVSSVETS